LKPKGRKEGRKEGKSYKPLTSGEKKKKKRKEGGSLLVGGKIGVKASGREVDLKEDLESLNSVIRKRIGDDLELNRISLGVQDGQVGVGGHKLVDTVNLPSQRVSYHNRSRFPRLKIVDGPRDIREFRGSLGFFGDVSKRFQDDIGSKAGAVSKMFIVHVDDLKPRRRGKGSGYYGRTKKEK